MKNIVISTAHRTTLELCEMHVRRKFIERLQTSSYIREDIRTIKEGYNSAYLVAYSILS